MKFTNKLSLNIPNLQPIHAPQSENISIALRRIKQQSKFYTDSSFIQNGLTHHTKAMVPIHTPSADGCSYDVFFKSLDRLHVTSQRLQKRILCLKYIPKEDEDFKAIAYRLEFDICIFIQDLIHVLHIIRWEERQSGVYAAAFSDKQADLFQSVVNNILLWIKEFNSLWFQHITDIAQNRKFFDTHALRTIDSINKSTYHTQTADSRKHLFKEYGIFHYIENWTFEKEIIDNQKNYIIWKKDHFPTLAIDTQLGGLFLLIDDIGSKKHPLSELSLKPPKRLYRHHNEHIGNKIEAVSKSINQIISLLKTNKRLDLQTIYNYSIEIRSICITLEQLNVSFSKKDILIVNYLDAVLFNFSENFSNIQLESYYERCKFLNNFFIWNTIIMENLNYLMSEGEKLNNFNIYKEAFGSFLRIDLKTRDSVLFKMMHNAFCDLRHALKPIGMTYQRFLSDLFIKTQISDLSEEDLTDNDIVHIREYCLKIIDCLDSLSERSYQYQYTFNIDDYTAVLDGMEYIWVDYLTKPPFNTIVKIHHC